MPPLSLTVGGGTVWTQSSLPRRQKLNEQPIFLCPCIKE